MANPDAKGAPKPPPNLRVSTDESRECDSCTHFERGKCALYNNLPVDSEWLCDSYEASGKPDDDRETPQSEQPRSLEQARVRVREHYRRTKASPQQ